MSVCIYIKATVEDKKQLIDDCYTAIDIMVLDEFQTFGIYDVNVRDGSIYIDLNMVFTHGTVIVYDVPVYSNDIKSIIYSPSSIPSLLYSRTSSYISSIISIHTGEKVKSLV